jgi:hypothetical protein
MSVRFASSNCPHRTPNKPGIWPPAQQANALLGILDEALVHFAGVAEAHTELVSQLRRQGGYAVVRGRGNSHRPGTVIGNAALVRADTTGPVTGWTLEDHRNVRLDWGDRGLNMPTTLAHRHHDDITVAHQAGHLPTQGDADHATWHRLALEARDYAESIPGPVALSYDWNRDREVVEKVFTRARGWVVLGFGDVSGTVARGFAPRSSRAIRHGYVPGVSDHREGLILSVARCMDRRTVDSLPKP